MLDTIPSTVTAMDNFEDAASVQAGACSFLFAVTQNNPRNKARVVRCGGRTAIVRAMEMHPGNEDVNNYGAHALLQVQDTVVTLPGGGSPAGSPDRGGGVADAPHSRMGGMFAARPRRSRDTRPAAAAAAAAATAAAAIPEVDGPGDGPPSAPSKFGLRLKSRNRRASVDAENDAPEIHELHGGSYQQPDRPEDPFGPSPGRVRAGGLWRRRKSVSSRGSSRGGTDTDGDDTGAEESAGEDGQAGRVDSGRRRRRNGGGGGFSLIRRSSKARVGRRPLDVRGAAGDVLGDEEEVTELARGRREERREAAAGDVDWVAGAGAGGGDEDNDIARIADLDGLSLAEDENGEFVD
jgi:hypothetical protein